MSMKDQFLRMVDKYNQNPSGFAGANIVYQFDLDGEGPYQVEIADGVAKFYDKVEKKPNCTLQLTGENLMKLVRGELNPTMAFMTGKLKIKGDLSLAMKLQSLLK